MLVKPEREREKVSVRKTSQINGLVKSPGMAGNRLLINFYSNAATLIPIHVSLGENKTRVSTPFPLILFLVPPS